jgi:glycosyltransferase involved in cell wall biosynthesis
VRILLVNWAKVWDGPHRGGGINGYCQALAFELVRRGHEVASLCGGTTCVPGPGGDAPGRCQVRRHPDWLGVRVFEVVNSPVLAPSILQFRRPMGEVSAPALEAEVGRLLDRLRPDVVHVHSLEGFSAGCVERFLRARGSAGPTRVVYSLHNYHPVCPQVYLMQAHRRPCADFRAGHACAECVSARDPVQVARARAGAYRRERAGAPTPPNPHVLRRLARALRGPAPKDRAPARSGPIEPPGRALDADLLEPWTTRGEETRGNTAMFVGEAAPPEPFDPAQPDWLPVENDVRPERSCALPPNDYARRREAMIGMLGRCHAVLAVSDFVRRKFVALGLDPTKVRTMPIGTRVVEIASRHREMLFEPPPFDPPRPVRLVFLGHNNWFKGLPMLADALELLVPELLARLDLTIAASDVRTIEWRFRRLEPRLGGLAIRDGYDQRDLPWLLGGKDLGIVPSVWWDNAPQTVFEFQACGVPILAAALGGIPEFVRDGEDGLLFRGNDRYDLARRLVRVLREPGMLGRLRAGVRAPLGIARHARDLEDLYRSLDEPAEVHVAAALRRGAGVP